VSDRFPRPSSAARGTDGDVATPYMGLSKAEQTVNVTLRSHGAVEVVEALHHQALRGGTT
jgi:hypothetical protein